VDKYILSFCTYGQGGGQRSDEQSLLRRQVKFSIAPNGFAGEDSSKGYYPLSPLIDRHCDS
jgi:hypothetical protein